jgi:hypothetical protein
MKLIYLRRRLRLVRNWDTLAMVIAAAFLIGMLLAFGFSISPPLH